MYQNFLAKSATVAVLVFGGLLVVLRFGGPIDLNLAAVNTEKDTVFEVSDSAKVFAKPDTATLQVGVVKEAKAVADAQSELNRLNNQMIESLKKIGVAADDIKTVSYDVSPKYSYNRDSGQQKIDGYRASARLEVRTTDFEKITEIIETATDAGANEVGQVSFVVDERDQYVAEARKKAIEGAKEKAKAIADEAGISLGRILDVQVMEGGQDQPMVFNTARAEMAMMDEAPGPVVQPGQNEVNVTVRLSYALQ